MLNIRKDQRANTSKMYYTCSVITVCLFWTYHFFQEYYFCGGFPPSLAAIDRIDRHSNHKDDPTRNMAVINKAVQYARYKYTYEMLAHHRESTFSKVVNLLCFDGKFNVCYSDDGVKILQLQDFTSISFVQMTSFIIYIKCA